MAYKFQRGQAILSGGVDQEGGIVIKDPATGALKATFSDTGEISGSHNLSIQGTVKFLGTAAAASTLDEDAFFYMDGTDGLMKRESMSNYATQIAGDGLAATDGVLAVDFNELTAADVNVADDSIIFIDANGNVTRKDSFVDYATAAAGTGIGASGGQFTLDLHELTAVDIASGDFIGIVDGSDNSTKKDSVDDLATLFAGNGLAASAAVLAVQVSGAVHVSSDKVSLTGSLAGDGIGFLGGVDSIRALKVNVDDSSIELNSDAIRVKADGITGAMLAPAVAGVGLAQDGSGNLDLDLNELGAAAIASGDSFAFVDATDSNASKKESVDDLATLFAGAGLVASSAVLAVANATNGGLAINANDINLDFNDLSAAAVDVAADSIAIVDANDSNATRKESIADLVTAMAGAGLSAAGGVLSTQAGAVDAFEGGDTLVEGYNYATGSATAFVSLPASPSVGDSVTVKAGDLGVGSIIRISKQGSHTIDGETSIDLESPYAAVSLVYLVANNWALV